MSLLSKITKLAGQILNNKKVTRNVAKPFVKPRGNFSRKQRRGQNIASQAGAIKNDGRVIKVGSAIGLTAAGFKTFDYVKDIVTKTDAQRDLDQYIDSIERAGMLAGGGSNPGTDVGSVGTTSNGGAAGVFDLFRDQQSVADNQASGQQTLGAGLIVASLAGLGALYFVTKKKKK